MMLARFGFMNRAHNALVGPLETMSTIPMRRRRTHSLVCQRSYELGKGGTFNSPPADGPAQEGDRTAARGPSTKRAAEARCGHATPGEKRWGGRRSRPL